MVFVCPHQLKIGKADGQKLLASFNLQDKCVDDFFLKIMNYNDANQSGLFQTK